MKDNTVFLISLHSSKPQTTIADRADMSILFSRGDFWYRGKLSIDQLFKILKPHLTKEKI